MLRRLRERREERRIRRDALVWARRRDAQPDDAEEGFAFMDWLSQDSRHRPVYEALRTTGPRGSLRVALGHGRHSGGQWAWGVGLATLACIALALVTAPLQLAVDIETGPGPGVSRRLPDGTQLVLSGQGRVMVRYTRLTRTLTLQSGEIGITPGRDLRALKLVVRDVTVIPANAVFDVDRGLGAADVAVLSGQARVKSGGLVQEVKAGEVVRADASGMRRLAERAQAQAAWTSGWIETADSSLPELAVALGRSASLPIFVAPKLEDCRVEGRFAVGDAVAALQAAAAPCGATARQAGRRILVAPKAGAAGA
jgi:transmembrane sensor